MESLFKTIMESLFKSKETREEEVREYNLRHGVISELEHKLGDDYLSCKTRVSNRDRFIKGS